jgi:hypothetical protein
MPALKHLVAWLALLSLTGCATSSNSRPDLSPWPEIRPDFQVAALRLRMHEYSITFAAAVDVAATGIEQRSADPTIRRNALLWKVRVIPEMRKACFRLEPVGALVDAWILARQMDQLFSEGAGTSAFGTLQPEAVDVARGLVRQMREIAASIAVSPETMVEFEQRFVDPWVLEHPLRDISFVRESPIARFADQSRTSGDVFQSVGTMEDLTVTLSQQARIYLADLPRHVRSEVDLMRSDLLPPDGVATLWGDVHVSATAANRIASSVEGVPSMLLAERRIVLDEIDRQRAIVMEAVSLERARTVGPIISAFAAERAELLRSFEAQRLATLDWATAERRQAILDVHRALALSMEALRGERAVVIAEAARLADLTLLRVAAFLVAAVVLAPPVAHAYARVWPRRWREPRE